MRNEEIAHNMKWCSFNYGTYNMCVLKANARKIAIYLGFSLHSRVSKLFFVFINFVIALATHKKYENKFKGTKRRDEYEEKKK